MFELDKKIYFLEEKYAYRIKAMNDKYLICTKPFNLKKTVFYTIVDLEKNIRGSNNLIFNIYDYENQEDIDRCLNDLINKTIEISMRNRIPLRIGKKCSIQ